MLHCAGMPDAKAQACAEKAYSTRLPLLAILPAHVEMSLVFEARPNHL